MDNPELYHRSNMLQKRDARQCLEDFSKKITWKNYGDTVIDIGCGDGGVTTDILKTYIPDNCKDLVGCDISENMVQFANTHYAREFVRFTVVDIEGELPDQLREKFDHAFSFYTLQWIQHQEIAFFNIYDLLTKGGDCLVMFPGHIPVYDVWRELARSPRWNYLMKDIECYVSPHHDSQEPEKAIEKMMTSVGFTNVEVNCLQKVFVFTAFKNAMNAINPFKIPLELQEDFLEDFVKVVRDMELFEHINNNVDDTFKIKMHYELIIAFENQINY